MTGAAKLSWWPQGGGVVRESDRQGATIAVQQLEKQCCGGRGTLDNLRASPNLNWMLLKKTLQASPAAPLSLPPIAKWPSPSMASELLHSISQSVVSQPAGAEARVLALPSLSRFALAFPACKAASATCLSLQSSLPCCLSLCQGPAADGPRDCRTRCFLAPANTGTKGQDRAVTRACWQSVLAAWAGHSITVEHSEGSRAFSWSSISC